MVETVLCRGGVNGDKPSELGIFDVVYILEEMYKEISSNQKATSTSCIFCIVPPSIAVGLFDISEFVLIKDYPTPKMAIERELGSVMGVRFILAHLDKCKEKSLRGNTVYRLEVFGGMAPGDWMFGDGHLKEHHISERCSKIIMKATSYYR